MLFIRSGRSYIRFALMFGDLDKRELVVISEHAPVNARLWYIVLVFSLMQYSDYSISESR